MQKIVNCPSGHFYDANKHAGCPYCEKNSADTVICSTCGKEHQKGVYCPYCYEKTMLTECPRCGFTYNKAAIKKVRKILAKEYPKNRPHQFGECHTIWAREKQLLYECHRICCRTTAEMNPFVCFD